MFALWLSFLLLPPGVQPVARPLPTAPEVRQSIERSLPFLMTKAEAWNARTFGAKKIHCISCHHIPLAVWTHEEAKARGFAVDQTKLDDLTRLMMDFSAAKKYPDEMVDGYLDTLMLVSESGTATQKDHQTLEMLQQRLAQQQRLDGSWTRQDGTTPNEPGFAIVPPDATDKEAAKRESIEVDTMWALLGLDALDRLGNALSPAGRELLVKQRSQALAFLKDAKGGTRSDWLAFRMLIERELGDAAKVGQWRQALLKQQNQDGGWALVRGGSSHALVTGQVLYALGIAGVGDDETPVRRAWRYLLSTQRKDGSWNAASRAIADHSNYVTVYFGSGWATLGLLKTLPAPTEPVLTGP